MRLTASLFLIGIMFVISCYKNTHSSDSIIYFCDAEKRSSNKNHFISNGIKFGGGKGINSEESHQGKSSCRLNNDLKYGMEKIITNPIPGEIISISVFRKTSEKNSQGYLTISSNDKSIYKNQNFSVSGKDKNGWEQLGFDIQVPNQLEDITSLKVFVANANNEKEIIYFDDLRIERKKPRGDQNDINYGLESLKIQLSDVDYEKLFAMRDSAIYQGVISDNFKKYFSGFLSYQGETFPIDIRLKGDWTDHLIGSRWSFRIKIKQGQSFKGLRQFSIQSPETRNFLDEWVVHEICEDENLLSTRYDFHPVELNGRSLGVYAIEEHFTKQLIESRKRREGPILKFDETGFWEVNLYVEEHNHFPENTPWYEAAEILPFKINKTLSSISLKNQFLIAQNLMLKHKNGDLDINNYLDIDNLAKAYAIMSVSNVEHTFHWHNQRFYYNPVISKLELIVFDCFSNPGETTFRKPIIHGYPQVGEEEKSAHDYFAFHVFNNYDFQKKYLKYLKKYSDLDYINNFFETKKSKIDSLERLISLQTPNYKYDKILFRDNAKKIQNKISDYEDQLNKKNIEYRLKPNKKFEFGLNDSLFPSVSLNAHLEKLDINGKSRVSLMNYYSSPLSIVGYSTKVFPDKIIPFSDPIQIKPTQNYLETLNILIETQPEKLFFNTNNKGAISHYSTAINQWPRPNTESKLFNLISEPLKLKSTAYLIKDNTITFLKGYHIISNNIIIPPGMEVIFQPGTELVFNKGLFFMSYSPVIMRGSEKNPIKIKSIDNSGKGFTVLKAHEKSEMTHVIFEGLNTFDNYGWTLTGAVTFYESDVIISKCHFKNNYCEDALNIIRSDFEIIHTSITDTYLDAFDGDFCTGIIKDSNFSNLGNDCLDFSGSTVSIINCNIQNAVDKGISCGEASNLKVNNIKISGAHTGVASKDNSRLLINNISISNCEVGFSSFEKKSEYGPGFMEVKNYSINSTEQVSFTDKNSIIELIN